jgi:hypothetical protein
MNIVNAKDQAIDEAASALPNVANAIQELLYNVVAERMQKQQVNGYTQEISTKISTKVSIQPFTAQQLIIRPEGQRAWRWFNVYALSNLDLKPDDVFKIRGVRYRIMEKSDWSVYGYFHYSVIEDYLPEDAT